jgi:Short C-terminal domain
MGLIITLIVFVGLAAIIVWIADWTSGGERRSTALDTLNQRLARGEIDRAEYEEKRKLIGRGIALRIGVVRSIPDLSKIEAGQLVLDYSSRNVCFWHKADISLLNPNVRFWG